MSGPSEPDRTELPPPGTVLTIVKLWPDGSEATRYQGEALPAREGWVVAHAPWARPRLDLGYLVFEPDDAFVEYFALDQPFNAFSLHAPDGQLKGWYCNVTYPTRLERDTIYWHDLYVDVIVYPDGQQLVLDEDELEASGIPGSNPDLNQMILDARDALLQLAAERAYPFTARDDHFPRMQSRPG